MSWLSAKNKSERPSGEQSEGERPGPPPGTGTIAPESAASTFKRSSSELPFDAFRNSCAPDGRRAPMMTCWPFGDQTKASSMAVSKVKRVDVDHATDVDLDAMPAPGTDRALEVCALDDALDALARMDPRRAQVVELRFFGGLTVEETAEVLKISPQSVMRDWRLARAWLTRELRR
jgi:RNA polymerase sigma factor (sigma-70 family)